MRPDSHSRPMKPHRNRNRNAMPGVFGDPKEVPCDSSNEYEIGGQVEQWRRLSLEATVSHIINYVSCVLVLDLRLLTCQIKKHTLI